MKDIEDINNMYAQNKKMYGGVRNVKPNVNDNNSTNQPTHSNKLTQFIKQNDQQLKQPTFNQTDSQVKNTTIPKDYKNENKIIEPKQDNKNNVLLAQKAFDKAIRRKRM